MGASRTDAATTRHTARKSWSFACGLAVASMLWSVGCNSGPDAVEVPDIDAEEAAEAAMSLYDKDDDGYIADSELDAAPELRAGMRQLDGDGDGKVTADEIVARAGAWRDSQVGLVSLRSKVTLDGRPVADAEITWEPAPWLGESLKASTGSTNAMGLATMSIPRSQRPTPQSPPGVQFGFYRVRISKMASGKETIPAKYNSETTLGQEVSLQDAGTGSQITYALKSK